MKIKTLCETLLYEGMNIERLWDKYKDRIDRETFRFLILIDPTYDRTPKGVSGDYGNWIINQYCQNPSAVRSTHYVIDNENADTVLNITNPDDLNFSELLYYFDMYKKWLDQKDINGYANAEAVASALSGMKIPEKAYTKWVRDGLSEVEFIKEFKNCTVYQPQSWRGSVALAFMSGWCTSDSRKKYGLRNYNKYTHDNADKLYIIIPNDQIEHGRPIEVNKRHDWLQFAPDYPQYAWGYKDGSLNSEEYVTQLWNLTNIITWTSNNEDVIEYFSKLFPNTCLNINFHAAEEINMDEDYQSSIIYNISEHLPYLFDNANNIDDSSIECHVVQEVLLDEVDVEELMYLAERATPEIPEDIEAKINEAIDIGVITNDDVCYAMSDAESSAEDQICEVIKNAFSVHTPSFHSFLMDGDAITVRAKTADTLLSYNDIANKTGQSTQEGIHLSDCLLKLLADNIKWPSVDDIDLSNFWEDVAEQLPL